MSTSWHQIRFWSRPCRGRLAGQVSSAVRIRSSARARRRWRSSWSASCPSRVWVAKAVMRYPPTSSKRNWAPGRGRSRRENDAHARWPFAQVQQVGVLGHVRAGPRLLGDLLQQAGVSVGRVNPREHWVPRRASHRVKLLGATGAVGADQDFPGRPRRVHTGQLGQGVPCQGDVVGGGAGPELVRFLMILRVVTR